MKFGYKRHDICGRIYNYKAWGICIHCYPIGSPLRERLTNNDQKENQEAETSGYRFRD